MPVLLSGAGAEMPASTLWQRDDYLADRIGHARLLVRTAPSEGATFGDAARLQAGGAQLYEFVDVVAADLLRELGSGGAQPSLYGARIELQVTELCLRDLGGSGAWCSRRRFALACRSRMAPPDVAFHPAVRMKTDSGPHSRRTSFVSC